MRPSSRKAVAKKTSTRKQNATAFRLKQERSFVRQILIAHAKKHDVHHTQYQAYCDTKMLLVNEVLAKAANIEFKTFRGWKGFVGDRLNKRLAPPKEVILAVLPAQSNLSLDEVAHLLAQDARRHGMMIVL